MTFRSTFELAMQNSEFQKHYDTVQKAYTNHSNEAACIVFSVGNESFYYGYDGIGIAHGKHNAKRAKYLIENGETLVIK